MCYFFFCGPLSLKNINIVKYNSINVRLKLKDVFYFAYFSFKCSRWPINYIFSKLLHFFFLLTCIFFILTKDVYLFIYVKKLKKLILSQKDDYSLYNVRVSRTQWSGTSGGEVNDELGLIKWYSTSQWPESSNSLFQDI